MHIGTHSHAGPFDSTDTVTTGSTREDPPTPVMLVPNTESAPQKEPPIQDPLSVFDTALALESIFLANDRGFQGMDPNTHAVVSKEVPQLTAEQIEQAKSVLPREFKEMSCWTCREQGHSQFRCPYMSEQMRMFAAYRFYVNQIAQNPSLVEWYKARANALRGNGADPGPKPGGRRDDRRQGQGPVRFLMNRNGTNAVNLVGSTTDGSTDPSDRSGEE